MAANGPVPAGKNGIYDSVRWRLLGAAVACAVAASCSVSSDPVAQLGLAPTSYDAAAVSSDDGASPLLAATEAQPTPRPDIASEEVEIAAAEAPAEDAAAEPDGQEPALAAADVAADAEPAEEQVAEAEAAPLAEEGEAASAPAKRGFLLSLFSTAETAPEKPSPIATVMAASHQKGGAAAAERETSPNKPIAALASNIEPTPIRASFGGDALPGVREGEQLFDIVRKSDIDDVSDLDLYEQEETYQVASAAGLARLAPNGLLRQRESVDVSCFKPELVHMLKTIERHYGRRVVVTSGYRSPEYNRRVRGARRSQHMFCAAADIQVEGVSKWELARFARSLPGRGGVGTYCHTRSVHVDVGPERDWNWRCRRKR